MAKKNNTDETLPTTAADSATAPDAAIAQLNGDAPSEVTTQTATAAVVSPPAAADGAAAGTEAKPQLGRYRITPKGGGEPIHTDNIHAAHSRHGMGDSVFDTKTKQPYGETMKANTAAATAR